MAVFPALDINTRFQISLNLAAVLSVFEVTNGIVRGHGRFLKVFIRIKEEISLKCLGRKDLF